MKTISINKTYNLLTEPLTRGQIMAQLDVDGDVKAIVAIDVSDMVRYDLEWLLDSFEELMLGSGILGNISYHVVGLSEDGYTLHFEVVAQVDLCD